jgi:hypothetical protein
MSQCCCGRRVRAFEGGISVRGRHSRRGVVMDAFRESSKGFDSDVQRESMKEGGRRRIV